jgi:uncharacterized protein (DUF1800 family)
MTDFWFNHFNVFAEKGPDKIWVGTYERDAIRPYALGNFRDLVRATAVHPAMLFYLDNWQNTDPNSPVARNRKIGINENYARELMELHTLGVNGGYTQQDVTSLAHILTGWGLSNGPELWQKSSFFFDPRRHDFTAQTLMGQRVNGSGVDEISSVLDGLALHPSTAHHVSYELAQYFVADDPPEALVDKMAKAFLQSQGDIPTVLRTMFRDPEFWDSKYAQNKFKPPFRYVVSALRAGGAAPQGDTRPIQGALNQMGEPLYRCLTPNGYSNVNSEWMNSDALLKRINFAKASGQWMNMNVSGNDAGAVAQSRGNAWGQDTWATASKAEPRLQTVLLLSSPEFVYY